MSKAKKMGRKKRPKKDRVLKETGELYMKNKPRSEISFRCIAISVVGGSILWAAILWLVAWLAK